MNGTVKRLLAVILCLSLAFACMAMPAAADESIGITRVSCTVSGESSLSRGFCWYTPEKCGSDVQLVSEADFSGTFENAETFSSCLCYEFRGQFCHKVTADGLDAGTKYFYRVGDAGADIWSDTGSFVTDDGDNSFSFITIADIQASNDAGFAYAAGTLRAAMNTLPQSEFTVNLGDFVNDNTNEEWDSYFKNFAFGNMSSTLVPVTGNHDGNITNKLNVNVFNSMFNLSNPDTDSATNWVNGVYYSFDYGNAHFAVLNTNDMYPMTQSQRNWLVNDMRSSSADWKFVFMHRAAYSEGKNINKPDTIVMRDVLIPLFDELDIDVVYAGHDHAYYRSVPVKGDRAVDNVTYVTEIYNGEEISFAYNPGGTVHVLPATAGTKRYSVGDAIYPIPQNCACCFSTKDLGGCFLTTEISGDKLIMKSYLVDDETQEISLIDSYAIKKDLGQNSARRSILLTDNITNSLSFVLNFVHAIIDMLYRYSFVLLPQTVFRALGN